ncbi:hypothetical protein LB505_011874 [Fusarium chuoi]|nr:hypothetical protein LB505_011874 [Fusarium chuoi]
MGDFNIKSVAVVGAGAAGRESLRPYSRVRTERNTWGYLVRIEKLGSKDFRLNNTRIYDADPIVAPIQPGGLPADIDKPLAIPDNLPTTTPPNQQERYAHTPIYQNLTQVTYSIIQIFDC